MHACLQGNDNHGEASEEHSGATYAESQSLVALRQQLDLTVSHLQGLDPNAYGAQSDSRTLQQNAVL